MINRNAALAASLLACAALTTACASPRSQIPPDMRAQAKALAKVCRADFKRLCQGVQPGQGRGLACLKDHRASLSSDCASALPQ